MSDLYKNKYRISSTRLQNWDYGWATAYFVTICTQNRECYFGDIVDGIPVLSEIGKIAQNEWIKTFEMRPDMNLTMGEYVVMPNHFHAIIGIGNNEYNEKNIGDGDGRYPMHCVSTFPSPSTSGSSKNQFGPQRKNLSSVIRGFKIGVTTNARNIYADFAWQPRFHDHIIRDNDSYERIRNYIINNPKKWDDDKFNNQKQ